MLEIDDSQNGYIRLSGYFDASQAAAARKVFARVEAACTVDFNEVEYISSAGLSVLLEAQQRLMQGGQGLRLINMNPHIKLVFEYAGFDSIFEIE